MTGYFLQGLPWHTSCGLALYSTEVSIDRILHAGITLEHKLTNTVASNCTVFYFTVVSIDRILPAGITLAHKLPGTVACTVQHSGKYTVAWHFTAVQSVLTIYFLQGSLWHTNYRHSGLALYCIEVIIDSILSAGITLAHKLPNTVAWHCIALRSVLTG